jgi:hypothetical protein
VNSVFRSFISSHLILDNAPNQNQPPGVVGVFNRITFPAFLLFPGLQLLPQFQRKCVNLHTRWELSQRE